LLESARAALGRGDAPAALALLERHELEFPTGTLVEERLAAKVLALCSLGRRDEAARAASRLLRMSPNSPLRARILDSCAYEH
jgi:RNA polymerase sigma-70 factor (ECF subfamily)